jgi:glutaredoxin 3
MSAPKVVMYAAGWCPYCMRARSLLESKGIDIEEIDVEAVPGGRTQMRARSGRGTVPQIFIGDHHVGGYEELEALDAEGRLDALLKPTGV